MTKIFFAPMHIHSRSDLCTMVTRTMAMNTLIRSFVGTE